MSSSGSGSGSDLRLAVLVLTPHSQSVGHIPAADRILEATYRALLQLPSSYLPPSWSAPMLQPQLPLGVRSGVASPAPSGTNTPRSRLTPLKDSLFAYCWIALAGMTTPADATAFIPFVSQVLSTPAERISMTNDVNLLAAPALNQTGIEHCVAIVCGTGTIGRTIRIRAPQELPPSPPADVTDLSGKEPLATSSKSQSKLLKDGLPLEDVGVARGWGYMLCDEGSAFWIGRLAIRYLLHQWDREHSTAIYSAHTPPKLPLYNDLLEYFAVDDPTELIGISALMGDFVEGLTTGEAAAKRNAYQAGAARVVFKWAFPEEQGVTISNDLERQSHGAALKIAHSAIRPLIELALETLGDRTVVDPQRAALNLGGGLWNSEGYRTHFLEGLAGEGVTFRSVNLVDDAAGEGAKALASVVFDK